MRRLQRTHTGDGRYDRKEIWIRDNELLLDDSIEALRGQYTRQRKTVIEQTETGAHHSTSLTLRSRCRRPCDADARRYIFPVGNIALKFIPDAETQSYIRPHAPIIAREHCGIHLSDRQTRRSSRDAEL